LPVATNYAKPLDFDPEPGLADNGDLERALAALLEVVGGAAKDAGTALIVFIDELQYVAEELRRRRVL
jgi:hypothetical protein